MRPRITSGPCLQAFGLAVIKCGSGSSIFLIADPDPDQDQDMEPVSSANLIATFQFLGNLKKTMDEARKDNGRGKERHGRGKEGQWPRPGKTMDEDTRKTVADARKDTGRDQE